MDGPARASWKDAELGLQHVERRVRRRPEIVDEGAERREASRERTIRLAPGDDRARGKVRDVDPGDRRRRQRDVEARQGEAERVELDREIARGQQRRLEGQRSLGLLARRIGLSPIVGYLPRSCIAVGSHALESGNAA